MPWWRVVWKRGRRDPKGGFDRGSDARRGRRSAKRVVFWLGLFLVGLSRIAVDSLAPGAG